MSPWTDFWHSKWSPNAPKTVPRRSVADPVGGGGSRGGRVNDAVGPVGLPRGGVAAVGGGAGAVAAGPEQLVRLGLQLLRMRRLLTNEGSLKWKRAEHKWKAIIGIRASSGGLRSSFEGTGF